MSRSAVEIGVPVLTSSAGYTLMWDNASVTTVDARTSAITWSSECGDTIDYYVCYGPDLNQAIAGYRKLTGGAPKLSANMECAVEFCQQHGMSVVDGLCPFMFLPRTPWFHRLHGIVRKVSGNYPAN